MTRENTASVRYHSSDDMTGVGELAEVTEPVAVVIRPGGTVDVYGHVAVVDQRPASAVSLGDPPDVIGELWKAADDYELSVIDAVATRAGILWQCPGCNWQHRGKPAQCEQCGQASAA